MWEKIVLVTEKTLEAKDQKFAWILTSLKQLIRTVNLSWKKTLEEKLEKGFESILTCLTLENFRIYKKYIPSMDSLILIPA